MGSALPHDSGAENWSAAVDRVLPGAQGSRAGLRVGTLLVPLAVESGDLRSELRAWEQRAPPLSRQNSEKRCVMTSSLHRQYPGWRFPHSPVAETAGGRPLQW